jgi:hypothetical protein
MVMKIQKQSENKFVLDNLEESLIILNKHSKIDFTNEKFIKTFKFHIDQVNQNYTYSSAIEIQEFSS